jgi:hypothetical protein
LYLIAVDDQIDQHLLQALVIGERVELRRRRTGIQLHVIAVGERADELYRSGDHVRDRHGLERYR